MRRASLAVAVLVAVIGCRKSEERPAVSPAPPPVPVRVDPAPDALAECDDSAAIAQAARVGACTSDADCTLTRFGDCWRAGQRCSVLAHNRTADLAPYNDALATYSEHCHRMEACRCATPERARCLGGRCEAE